LVYLLIYCTVQHDVEELSDVWQGLQQSAVDGEREDILSSNNMLIEWSSKELFQIRRICFSNRLIIYKVIVKVRHSFVIKNWYSNCNIFKLIFLHSSATRFLRNGKKYHIYFVDNSLLFPTVEEFSKSINSWWSYAKSSTPLF